MATLHPVDTDGNITRESKSPFKPNYSEFWLDEKCSEPIVDVPGFSRLCNACISVFEKGITYGPWLQRHVKHLETLLESAKRGCIICSLFMHEVRQKGLDRSASRVLYCFKPSRDTAVILFRMFLGQHTPLLTLSLVPSGESPSGYILVWRLNFLLDQRGQHSMGVHEVLDHTASVPNQQLAKRWFRQCKEMHRNCWPENRQAFGLPTRLVEICSPTTVRVVGTASLSRDSAYIALSYCWGKTHFLSLKKDSISQMSKGIALSNLPKTFRDVIVVAEWFKIRYLWIDSLCIIQDSLQDWLEESQRMGSIYHNAYLTISATGAHNPTHGCFFQRYCDLVRNLKVRLRKLSGPEKDYFCFDRSFWSSNIVDSPLGDRAWALQERLLSPRILHFGRQQIAWECQEVSACETFPKGLPEESLARDYSIKRVLVDEQKSFLQSWEDIIPVYSKLALTKCTDRCIAFAGIAEGAQALARKQGCESKYFAGFWRYMFEHQLVWAADIGGGRRDPNNYLAPSFSWLSFKGRVRFPAADKLKLRTHIFLEILDVKINILGDTTFGPIEQGSYIRVRGRLGVMEVRRNNKRSWDITSAGQSFDDEHTPRGRAILDDNSTVKSISYTALAVVQYGPEVHGLLLMPINDNEESGYCRVGKFHIDNLCDLWDGKWRSYPPHSFIIA